jgi:hypothetical protein
MYRNDTHPDLTYKICSSLDVYRPWCPTKLDNSLNILEWGDCLDDCPSESVNSACLTDPEFPVFSDGSGGTTNFTSYFLLGIGAVTDEVNNRSISIDLFRILPKWSLNRVTHRGLVSICLL